MKTMNTKKHRVKSTIAGADRYDRHEGLRNRCRSGMPVRSAQRYQSRRRTRLGETGSIVNQPAAHLGVLRRAEDYIQSVRRYQRAPVFCDRRRADSEREVYGKAR